jgi:hypothetical protein
MNQSNLFNGEKITAIYFGGEEFVPILKADSIRGLNALHTLEVTGGVHRYFEKNLSEHTVL